MTPFSIKDDGFVKYNNAARLEGVRRDMTRTATHRMTYGTMTVESRWDDATAEMRPWVTHADPRILISREFLQAANDGRLHVHPNPANGDVLTFEAMNGRWVYRLVEYVPGLNGWAAEWPD